VQSLAFSRKISVPEPRIEDLVEEHRSALHSYVSMRLDPRLRRKEPASDIVQSALREVLEHPGNFEYRGPQAFRAFLIRAVEHKIANKRRYWEAQRRSTQDAQGALELDALPARNGASPTPSELAVGAEAVERLRAALDELSEDDRRLLTMRRFAGLSAEVVAEELGLSASTVRERLGRIMTFLSRRLGHAGEGNGVART
jgi:RNA polymerase sigma-70 factor (ECF subfamily)